MNLIPNRILVPKNLGSLIDIDRQAEVPARSAGLNPSAVEDIWCSVQSLYRTGLHPAISLVVRRHGQIVLKRSIGGASGNGPVSTAHEPKMPLTTETPICLFSASKAITALLLHKLVEQGQVALDAPVARYLPSFAAHGKGRVTVSQLLAHRAGIPQLPIKHPDPALLHHWDAVVHLLCLAPPMDKKFKTQAYHALTGGFIVGEIIRRVSGAELPELLREWLAKPLGCTHLTYGLPPEHRANFARSYCTGMAPMWPLSSFIENITGIPFAAAVEASNGVDYLSSVVPAGNIFATADETSRVFQMLLNQGCYQDQQVLSPATVANALRPSGGIKIDAMLKFPMRFSPGFMLGETPFGLYGPDCSKAFGHLGFVNVLAWADPERAISVALLNTGKSVAASGVLRLGITLRAIAQACPKIK